MGWGGGGVPPLLAILSHRRGAILCPLAEALGASLAEHPILLGDAAIGMGDLVATRCLGTCLEGVASLGVGLCQVEQEGGTVGTDHLGALEQQVGDTLGVTHEGGEAGGGDELDHGLMWRGVVGVVPLACSYPTASGAPVEGRAPKSGQCPNWHTVSGGGRCRARLKVDPIGLGYEIAGSVASVGVSGATLPLV